MASNAGTAVGGNIATPTQTPTVTAGAYAAQDAVGGLLTFANSTNVDSLRGIICGVLITDLGKQDATLDLFLFSSSFTATADNAALDILDADLPNCIGVVSVDTWYDLNDSSVGYVECQIPFVTTGTSLYGQLVTRSSPTYSSTSDLKITLKILQD